ncbi:hypothetical protein BGZ88_011860 [Linnemannia elongata]|nr:hypothetical protein BGZ88_011860 [Linnemannia elongata]
MSSTSSATTGIATVGRYTYTLPTSIYSYSPNPNPKVMGDLDNKPPGYQWSIIILIAFSCLVLLGAVIGSALYWFRYRAKWRMEEKEAFEIIYPRDKAKARNSRGFEGEGESDGHGNGESGGVVKSGRLVRRPEGAVVVEGEKRAKRLAISGHRVSNNGFNVNSRPQGQQRQAGATVEQENDEVVKIEIALGQSNALEAECWMEEDRRRYQELSELTKSPVFVQHHQALHPQRPFQPQSSVGQYSPSFSQYLCPQSLQSQQHILLQQHQHLQEQEQHQRQHEQGKPIRKPWQLPLGLYDQLFRKKSRTALSRASSKWVGGMDSLSPTLSTSLPPLPSLSSSSAAPSAVSTTPLSVDVGLSTFQPPPGLSRLTTINTPSYPAPSSATPTTTPTRPFRIKIGGARYCLTPSSTSPCPSSSSAPRSPSSTVFTSSSLQPSLSPAPINIDSPTQPWNSVPACAFPMPLSTTSLSISDGGGARTPQTVSPIESLPILQGVSKRTVHACVGPPQADDEEEKEEEDRGKKGEERELEESVMSPTVTLVSTQFRRFYDLEIN